MRSQFKKYGVLATVAALAVPALVQAAPPGIDPKATVVNRYGPSAGDDIYMNKNQLALRITGKDYEAHIDNNEAHWQGSGMELIEDMVNDLILNAEYNGPTTSTDKMFRNWVDLLLKRFLVDGNPLTPIDYDTQTFYMVDGDHAAGRLPSQPTTATLTDINGDGIEGGFEPQPFLLDGTCLNLPGFGDMCMTMYLINVSDPLTDVVTGIGTLEVNDVARPALDFSRYDSLFPDTTSHLFLAAQPKLTFDNELDSCDEPEFPVPAGNCDEANYRDDDDALYLEIQLSDFRVDLLFEPPFTTDVTATTVGEEGCENTMACGTAAYSHTVDDWFATTPGFHPGTGMPAVDDWALNITDMVDGDAFNEDIGGNDYDINATDKYAIPGCPLLRGGDDYAPECDLSNYLKFYGSLEIPILKIGASISIVSAYNDILPDVAAGPSATTDTISLGVVIKSLDLSTDLIFVVQAGPFCDNSATVNSGGGDHRAAGFDKIGVYPYQTDNPNNCTTEADSDGIDNRSDDSTYLKSKKFEAVLSYIRAEIEVAMADFFEAATNPSYFLGPTGIGIDATLIADLDWPFPSTVDYLYILASLDSSVDATDMTNNMDAYRTLDSATWVGDTIEEFWADNHGIMMPFNMGVGFEWYSDISTPTQMSSCVTDEAAYTGYVDGYGQGDNADDPVVSHPLPSLKTEWYGGDNLGAFAVENGDEDMASSILQRKIPDVNGSEPFSSPTRVLPQFTPALTNDGAYGIGLGIHQNLLSKALYEMVIKGLLCIEFGVTDKADALLDTGLFQFFVPYLYENYADAPVGIRIVPYVANPNNVYWNSGQPGYPSRISEAQADNSCASYPCETTVENPVPRIHTGGINTFDLLKQRYAGEISTANIGPVWPDLSVVIPHLVLEFYVWDESGPSDVIRRAFALDVGINVGLNIDITQDPGAPNAGTYGDSTFMDPVTTVYPVMARPAYSGTNFPIGCHTTAEPANSTAYPCEITGVPSRLVVFLGGILDPELNSVLVYDEMSDAVTSEEAFLVGGNPDYTLGVFEDAISNLIGLALSSEISLFTEIGFDPAAWLDIPIVLNFPYIGPSYVLRDDAAVAPSMEDLGCDDSAIVGLGKVVPNCADPIGLDAVAVRDVSDNDTNGFGDYLIASFSVEVTYIQSDYLFRLIDSFLEPVAYPCESTTITPDVVCQSDFYQLGSFLDDILGAAPAAPSNDIVLPRGYVSPETYIKGIRKANAIETIIDFEGYHPNDGADTLTYAWRVDGGFWTSFMNWNSVRVPGLLEGNHVFEVKAKDRHGNVEWTPARIEFVVDSIGPKTQILGDRVQGVDTRFYVEVDDSQTLPEDVRVSYAINGGEWTRYSYNKDVAMTVEPGRHTLNVRTVDEAGNVTTTALNFSVEEGGFGCSVAGHGSAADASLLLLLVPAIVIAIRRRRV